jgi:solute carrier family 25 phosphate transporter 3
MVGGILSCGITHMLVTPLDVVKCRMQTQPEVYKGIGQGLSLASKEGALLTGWLPTLIGYSAQGMFKFGMYEIFKDYYADLVGPTTFANYKSLVFAAASASAEFIADVALCPFEAVKVKMQTSLPSANFPSALGPALSQVSKEGKLYAGIYPLWGRQVPYTIVKFVAFEGIVNAFYDNIFTEGKANYSKTTQLSITFASGYIAGVLCAVVSQPADTLVSKMNKDPTAKPGELISKLGVSGLYAGLGMRIIMVGTLTGLQWWIYDTFKVAVGLQASGGSAAPAPAKKN